MIFFRPGVPDVLNGVDPYCENWIRTYRPQKAKAGEVAVVDVEGKTYQGGCRCGQVRYAAIGLSDIWYCHCCQCRSATGHFLAAAGVARACFSHTGKMRWTAISATTDFGYCAKCDSLLLWNHKEKDHISVIAGNIDNTAGLEVKGHIFVGSKAPYYEITDGLPQYDAYPTEGTR